MARHNVCSALACRAFGVSGTCYLGSKSKTNNEESADLLARLTDARKTWSFGLCFLHLCDTGQPRNHKRVHCIYCELGTEPADQTVQADEAGQTRRTGRAVGAQHDLVHGTRVLRTFGSSPIVTCPTDLGQQ